MLTTIEEGKRYRLRNGEVVTTYGWLKNPREHLKATFSVSFKTKNNGIFNCWGDGHLVGRRGIEGSDFDIIEDADIFEPFQLDLFGD